MFTGLVEEIGEVLDVRTTAEVVVLTVRGPTVAADARRGDSIAVNGVCLTVIDSDGRTDGAFTVELVPETLARTSLKGVAVGTKVNLERALPAGGRLGGHIVQGHVDGVGTLVARTPASAATSCASSCHSDWPATSSRRARSPSTASRSPSPGCRTAASASRSSRRP